jgi:hypothetical protein
VEFFLGITLVAVFGLFLVGLSSDKPIDHEEEVREDDDSWVPNLEFPEDDDYIPFEELDDLFKDEEIELRLVRYTCGH